MDTNLKGYNNVRAMPGVEERAGETKCVIHNRVEYLVRGTYKVCKGCGHAYQTADDLLREWYNVNDRPKAKMATVETHHVVTAVRVPFCPLCLHGF